MNTNEVRLVTYSVRKFDELTVIAGVASATRLSSPILPQRRHLTLTSMRDDEQRGLYTTGKERGTLCVLVLMFSERRHAPEPGPRSNEDRFGEIC